MPVPRHEQRLILALATLAVIATGAAAAADKPFREFDETFKSWKLYCQLWTGTRQVECELTARGTNDRTARLVWLRSTEKWREGLRFRVSAESLDLDKLVRVWADRAVFKPDSPCKPYRFETNTCAVTDPDINRRMVEKMVPAPEVSIVGQSPASEKTEVRFPLAGFREALERSDAIRAMAGRPWATSPNGD